MNTPAFFTYHTLLAPIVPLAVGVVFIALVAMTFCVLALYHRADVIPRWAHVSSRILMAATGVALLAGIATMICSTSLIRPDSSQVVGVIESKDWEVIDPSFDISHTVGGDVTVKVRSSSESDVSPNCIVTTAGRHDRSMWSTEVPFEVGVQCP